MGTSVGILSWRFFEGLPGSVCASVINDHDFVGDILQPELNMQVLHG